MIEQLGVELDARGNVKTGDDYVSSVLGVFTAGDARRGHQWLMGESKLP